MQAILDQIADWLKGMLVDGIMNNLEGMFDAVNQQVSDVASQVGNTPQNFSPGVFSIIRNISESVIIPMAGLFLTFIACYELIQLIIEHNNLANPGPLRQGNRRQPLPGNPPGRSWTPS